MDAFTAFRLILDNVMVNMLCYELCIFCLLSKMCVCWIFECLCYGLWLIEYPYSYCAYNWILIDIAFLFLSRLSIVMLLWINYLEETPSNFLKSSYMQWIFDSHIFMHIFRGSFFSMALICKRFKMFRKLSVWTSFGLDLKMI